MKKNRFPKIPEILMPNEAWYFYDLYSIEYQYNDNKFIDYLESEKLQDSEVKSILEYVQEVKLFEGRK